jgi:hypothetical protein
MHDATRDIYDEPLNKEAFITDSIISTLNLMQKHVKRSFYLIIDNIFLLLQKPLVAAILKEFTSEKDRDKEIIKIGATEYIIVYTTACDPEFRVDFRESLKKNISTSHLLPMRIRRQDQKEDPQYHAVLAEVNYINYDKKNSQYPTYTYLVQKDPDAQLVIRVIDNIARYINKPGRTNKSKNASKSGLYYEYLKKPLINLEKNYYGSVSAKQAKVSPELKKKIEDTRTIVIAELKGVLKTIFQDECVGSPLLRRSKDSALVNVFCILKILEINSEKLRRREFNYTTRFVFSHEQEKLIKQFLYQNLKTSCGEKCGESCVFPREKAEVSDFIKKVETSVGSQARSISDYVFHSGVIEFADLVRKSGRLDPGGEGSDEDREDREFCLFRRIILNSDRDMTMVSAWLMPIRIHGAPWLNLAVINSKSDNWSKNYHIFRKIYPKLARNIRRSLTGLYFKELKTVYKQCLEGNSPNNSGFIDELNERCRVYEFIFPFPRITFVLGKNITANTKLYRRNPTTGEKQSIYMRMYPNRYFPQQIQEYDGFTNSLREKNYSNLQSVENENRKEVSDIFQTNPQAIPSSRKTLKNPFEKAFDRFYKARSGKKECKIILVKGTKKQCSFFTREFGKYFGHDKYKQCSLDISSLKNLLEVLGGLSQWDVIHFADCDMKSGISDRKDRTEFIEFIRKKKLVIISGEKIDRDSFPEEVADLVESFDFVKNNHC